MVRRRTGADEPPSNADSTSAPAAPEHASASARAATFFTKRRDRLAQPPTLLNGADEQKVFRDHLHVITGQQSECRRPRHIRVRGTNAAI
jgi:hypothetical protein